MSLYLCGVGDTFRRMYWIYTSKAYFLNTEFEIELAVAVTFENR
jgi:hypothetical protein